MNNIKDKSFLVTGGAGFIGSHIASYLLSNGAKFVRILDNLSTGFIENIEQLNRYQNFEFMHGDITDYNVCLKSINGIDVVVHQAALGSIPRSIENPLNSHNSNVNGFLNMLNAAKENGIKRFVYASSSSVYGDDTTLPKIESTTGNQLSPYAVTKYINELYASIYTKIYNMECIGLRYFNVFGPNQNPTGPYAAVIPKFINLLMDDDSPIINGDGTYSRDFTYISNVVSANLLAMTTTNSACFGEAFNIGTGKNITINELYFLITNTMKKTIEPIYNKPRIGDVPHSLANITKANKLLGYVPLINIKEGLILTIKNYTNDNGPD